MKNKKLPLSLTAIALFGFTASSHAASIISSSFARGSGVVNVDSTIDWGYFTTSPFTDTDGESFVFDGSPTASTNRHGTADSGTATWTADQGLNSKGNASAYSFTYTNGADPTTATVDALGGQFGSFPGGSVPGYTLSIANLGGVGERTITLYLGSNRANQVLSFSATLTDIGGSATDSINGSWVGGGGAGSGGAMVGAFYQLTYFSSDPNASLSIDVNGVSGSGQAEQQFGGWAITAVPEPSAALLGTFGMLLLLRRRRV
jgi:hypothetical protein